MVLLVSPEHQQRREFPLWPFPNRAKSAAPPMNSFVKTTKISVAGAAVAGRGRQQTDERRRNPKPKNLRIYGPVFDIERKNTGGNGRSCTGGTLAPQQSFRVQHKCGLKVGFRMSRGGRRLLTFSSTELVFVRAVKTKGITAMPTMGSLNTWGTRAYVLGLRAAAAAPEAEDEGDGSCPAAADAASSASAWSAALRRAEKRASSPSPPLSSSLSPPLSAS